MASNGPTQLQTSLPSRGRGERGGRGMGSNARSGDSSEHRGRRGRARGGREGEAVRARGENAGEKGKGLAVQQTAAAEDGPISAPLTKPNLQRPDEEDPEAQMCFICASTVQHIAIAPCNHRTCHICSIRMRALYKTKACAHCRTESNHVILTDSPDKKYEHFSTATSFRSDDSLGIYFENSSVYDDTRLLLQYNCPDGECDVACLGWPDLHRHVKTTHGKMMCDLCTRNKKVFTHEHELFTHGELRKHQKFGDDNPGAVDQSGFKGHPECGFCRERFYGDDELYSHCRDKHERCHICDRQDGGRKQQYYVNYDSLELHFRKNHFLCPDGECLEKKFVVFDTEMDLKAHQIESHPGGLSKDALRDARRVDMSAFQFRTPHEQESRRDDRRRGGGRGGGRGRDPGVEPLPASSAQPLSRAELAYQRQLEAQNLGVTGRVFGSRLTPSSSARSEAFAARPSSSSSTSALEPATVTARPGMTAAANQPSPLNTSSQPASSGPPNAQEQARSLRHTAVVERASNMLCKSESKLLVFRAHVSGYRNSELSATQLIDHFFALFDAGSKEVGKLVKELAEIFETAAKREALLKAWNDWRAINEDYPSLPGGQATNGGGPAHGGSRVLKLKSSTAQSSRSSVNRQASWSTTTTTTTSPSHPFPALAAASTGRIGARPGQTPWAAAAAASSSSSSSSGLAGTRPAPIPARQPPSTSVGAASNVADAFPALPAAIRSTSTMFGSGHASVGHGLRRDHGGRNAVVGSAWTAAPQAPGGATTATADGADAAGKRKGNKNKKVTLMQWG